MITTQSPNSNHSDTMFLKKYIKYVKTFCDTDIIYIRNTELVIQYASSQQKRIWNDESDFDNSELYLENVQNIKINNALIKKHQMIDKYLLKNKSCRFIMINPHFPVGTRIMISTTKTIINLHTNNIVGYITTSQPISINALIKTAHSLSYTDMVNTIIEHDNSEQFNLTPREQEILFLYCLRLSSQKIADILSLHYNTHYSHHTVGNIIRASLFRKIGVYNSEALIQKTIKLNLLKFNIPTKIIPTTIILIY